MGATAEAMVETDVFTAGEKEMSFPLCTWEDTVEKHHHLRGLAQVGTGHLQYSFLAHLTGKAACTVPEHTE